MKIFWNRNGAICCAKHAPMKGSDTWVSEGWCAIGPDDQIELSAELKVSPLCEICRHVEQRKLDRIVESTKPTLASMLVGDNIDARAMLAVHVHAESRHRSRNLPPYTPALRVRVYRDTRLRECIEAENGEALL